MERPKAVARKKATQAKKGNNGKAPTGGDIIAPPVAKGKTRDRVAAELGMSGMTDAAAKKVENGNAGERKRQERQADLRWW